MVFTSKEQAQGISTFYLQQMSTFDAAVGQSDKTSRH